jgi:hypothetical protein
MILPGKHLRQDRALLTVGAEILTHLDEPRTVSELWERVRQGRELVPAVLPLSFDWFVLSLNLLFAIYALQLVDGVVVATRAEP